MQVHHHVLGENFHRFEIAIVSPICTMMHFNRRIRVNNDDVFLKRVLITKVTNSSQKEKFISVFADDVNNFIDKIW